jgi:hypothetical protein
MDCTDGKGKQEGFDEAGFCAMVTGFGARASGVRVKEWNSRKNGEGVSCVRK